MKEVRLEIIRKWPEGFDERLQHVWVDLLSFTPNYKLYDLQRCLAEFGFTMKVYEGGDADDDLATLVRRLARALRDADPQHDLPAKAIGYLDRQGLKAKILRESQRQK